MNPRLSALPLPLPLRLLILFVATLLAASAATVPLSTALDGAGLVWTTGGADIGSGGASLNPLWSGQTTISQDGTDSAQAPALQSPDSESWIETTVTGPGTLTWRWRLDLGAEPGSYLDLQIGDESAPRRTLFQTTPWTADSEAVVEPGPVTVRWRFGRSPGFENSVTDTAFVDTVAFVPFGPPLLQSAASINARGFTARWTELTAATSYVVEISPTADFAEFISTDSIPAPASSQVIAGLEPLTTYHYRLVARGPDLLEATSAATSVSLPAIQRPTNDSFGAATPLSGQTGTVNATTLDATVQTDEPFSHQASTWFTWTSTSAGRWSFRATPTVEDNFAPVLYLYTGSTLATLDEITVDQGSGLLEFDTLANVTYRIAIDGVSGSQGPYTLAWERLALHTPPANDAFINSVRLTTPGTVSGANIHATTETGEPASTGGGHTVWWRWTATGTGLATFDASASAIPVVLAAYSGTSLTSLTRIAEGAATVAFPVVQGTTYHLALDGASGAEGSLAFTWSFAAASLDQIITIDPLPDVGRDAPAFNVFAYSDSGLPVTLTLVGGPATFEDNLLTLTGATGTVTLRAHQPGDAVYRPATLDKSFVVRAPPANDAFANAAALTGSVVTGTNLYASAQEFDPFPASHSVWWRWTAPATGVLRLDTAASAIPTTLAVLTGTAPDDLDLIIEDTRPGQRAKVEFPVTAGVTYRIAVDAYDDLQGAIQLDWTFLPPSLPQTITFAALPDVGLGASPFYLDATASSGLPVTFSLAKATPAVTLDGDLLTFTGKPGPVEIRANQPGDAYYAAAPGITVAFSVRPPPGNDDFANAFALAGSVVTGSNIDASAEPFDPFPASHSVWWRWTAPSAGVLTLDTAASAIPVAISVVTGPSIDELELIASDIRPDARGRVVFPVAPGVTYRIALDGLDERQGALSLAWSFAKPSLPQTITFDALPNLTAGDPAFLLAATSSSGLPVTLTLAGGPATLVDDLLTLTNLPGTVKLVATQPGDAYYAPAPAVTRTFTVAKAPAIKITLSDLRHTYDGSAKAVTATTDRPHRYAELLVTYSGPGHPVSANAPFNAGTYTVVATADASRQTAKLVIDKAPLTVTALDARKLAGQDNPPFDLTYSGFQGGDDETKLLTAPLAKSSATKTSPGSTLGYPITPSGGLAANYLFKYVPGKLYVDTFSGRYEALLTDPVNGLPVAKLEFTVAASGAPFSGKLTVPTETAAVAIKGTLALDSDTDTASTLLSFATKTHAYLLALDMTRLGDFTATLSRTGVVVGGSTSGRTVFVPARGEKIGWAGAHTVLLRDPFIVELDTGELDPDAPPTPPLPFPEGTGHALGTIDASGNLKLAGRLADGSILTATLAPDSTVAYRLFALPYAKRLDSQIAGTLSLSNHPELAPRRHISVASSQSLYWTKATLPPTTKTPDKSYRAGFGPLAVGITLDPWLPPVPAVSLAQRLELSVNPLGAANFVPAFGPGSLDLGASFGRLPTQLSLSAKNIVAVPVTTPLNPSKFALVVVPTTGAFSGSFVLTDTVPAPTVKNPAATKIVDRKVTFTGVLRQPPASENPTYFGAGHFLVPALPGATDTSQPVGDLRLRFP
ncbi:MAG: MBG-2 domain-containing protein [Burkholderiales bacterium]|nr:MBG-2 domain-containing protein [Opitutaceae bacterium]